MPRRFKRYWGLPALESSVGPIFFVGDTFVRPTKPPDTPSEATFPALYKVLGLINLHRSNQ